MNASLNTYLVEDSPVLQASLIAALEELAPVKVMGTASDESSAIEWLNSNQGACDLVIIDIFLKAGSGLGVLEATYSDKDEMKLVVLSNYATPDMRRRCLALGAARVFDKSNEIDDLLTYCQSLTH